MKYTPNILVITLFSVLGVAALRLGIPFETLLWYLLGGALMLLAVLAVDCAILDLWVEDCHGRTMPLSIFDLPGSIVGLFAILWPLVAVTYLPVRCVILARRRLEARRMRSNPKGVSLTHTAQESDPGASTPPICTFEKGCH